MDEREIINQFWETEGRKKEIFDLLNDIDRRTIRPIREGDTQRITDLEAQAAQLRKELASL